MAQDDLTLRQNEPEELTIPQIDNNWIELDKRTKVDSDFEDYDSLDKVGEKVRELEQNGTAGTPGWESIYLGSGAYLNTQGDFTTPTEWKDYVNSVGFEVTSGKLIVLELIVKRKVNNETVMMREMYTFNKNNISGTWGNNSANGTVEFNDFIFRYGRVITLVSFPLEIIDLGDIGNTEIHTHINGLDTESIIWEDLVAGTTYYFDAIYQGIVQTYEYKGSLPRTVGSGTTPLVVTDFDLVYTDLNSDVQALITSLQQSIEQDPVATAVPEFLNGISIGSSGVGLIQVVDGFNTLFGAAGGTFFINAINGLGFSGANITMNTDPILSLSRVFWNPATNTYADGDSSLTGKLSIVSNAGTVDFGSGSITFGVGDVLGYHEGKYIKFIDNNQSSGSTSPVRTAVKESDESKTFDDTLTADTDLTISVEANSIYKIEMLLIMSANGVPDGQTQYIIPNGASGYRYVSDDAANNLLTGTIDTIYTMIGQGDGVKVIHRSDGILKTDEAGNFSIAWSQKTSNANPTTVYQGSYVKLTKLT